MNTNEQAQATVEYVRVNSRQPMMLANLVGDSVNEIAFKEGSKVFFNKDYTYLTEWYHNSNQHNRFRYRRRFW